MEKQEERVTGEDTGGGAEGPSPPPEISKQKMFPILIAVYNVYGRPFFERII